MRWVNCLQRNKASLFLAGTELTGFPQAVNPFFLL